jgi:3(or 17)beta-hydroxysteroid dehydrogenase
MRRLEQKIACVTGGASGLGRAIARRLAAEGARVVITDIQSDSGSATAAEDGFTFLQHDVCDEKRWSRLIREIEEQHGRLDILVNNAGILGPADGVDLENTTLETWRRVFAVNVEGVFLGCRLAMPAMTRAGGGSIINIASIAGLLATPYATAYGASKAAVRQLTKSVAQHCAQQLFGIRCNAVSPGTVRTPLWDQQALQTAQARGISIDEMIAQAKAVCPMGDLTRPEDVAAAVSFLASEDSRHITGTELVVDGGVVNCDTYLMTRMSLAADGRSSR